MHIILYMKLHDKTVWTDSGSSVVMNCCIGNDPVYL